VTKKSISVEKMQQKKSTLHEFLEFLCSSLTSLHPDAFRAMQKSIAEFLQPNSHLHRKLASPFLRRKCKLE